MANEYAIAHTHNGYHTHRLPKVVWLTPQELAKLAHEKTCAESTRFCTCAMEIKGVMYLVRAYFVLGKDDQQLVHESVHYQQDTNPGGPWKGPDMEAEAYAVEALYVKEMHRGELPDPEMVAVETKQRSGS